MRVTSLGTGLAIAAALAGGVALRIWQAPIDTPPPAATPQISNQPVATSQPAADMTSKDAVVRLEPATFSHRLDGDWRREGRPADAQRGDVTIPAPVDMMATPVTAGAYMECVNAGACIAPLGPTSPKELPVTGVSWVDANAYAAWYSTRTGQSWRLPTDAEWAHGAAELFVDDALEIADDPANPAVRWLAEYEAETERKRGRDQTVRPVGTLNQSSTGMKDIGGAVWEWTSTCLRIVDTDASGAIIRETPSCGVYIAEGRHRAALTMFVRDPKSGGCSVGVPPDNMGFRLVRPV